MNTFFEIFLGISLPIMELTEGFGINTNIFDTNIINLAKKNQKILFSELVFL